LLYLNIVTNYSSIPSAEDQVVDQDPKFSARSTLGKTLGVPLCAVAVSRVFRVNAKTNVVNVMPNQPSSKKKRKITPSRDFSGFSDMAASDGEDISDINFLFSEDEDDGKSKTKQTK